MKDKMREWIKGHFYQAFAIAGGYGFVLGKLHGNYDGIMIVIGISTLMWINSLEEMCYDKGYKK